MPGSAPPAETTALSGTSPSPLPGSASPREAPLSVPLPATRRTAMFWPTSKLLVRPPGRAAAPPPPESSEFSAMAVADGNRTPNWEALLGNPPL